MRNRALLLAVSFGLLALVADARQLAAVELPKGPHGIADVVQDPSGRLVVNVDKKGAFWVDTTDTTFQQNLITDQTKRRKSLVKVDAKKLRAHLDQAHRAFLALRQADPQRWPKKPHVLMRLDRNAPWGSLTPLFAVLAKTGISDVRIAVELGKKHGVLKLVQLAKAPKKPSLTIRMAPRGVAPGVIGKRVDAYMAKHVGERITIVFLAAAETNISRAVGVLDRLFHSGVREFHLGLRK